MWLFPHQRVTSGLKHKRDTCPQLTGCSSLGITPNQWPMLLPSQLVLLDTGAFPLSPACNHSSSYFLATYLCKGLKEGQVEPLKIGKGLDTAHHISRNHLGHTGVQVQGYLLEHLGLMEIQLPLKRTAETSHCLENERTWSLSRRQWKRAEGGRGPRIHTKTALSTFLAGEHQDDSIRLWTTNQPSHHPLPLPEIH